MSNALKHFMRVHRAQLSACPPHLRLVYHSEIARKHQGLSVDGYLAEKAVALYRTLPYLMEDIKGGLPLAGFKTSLGRFPTAETFRESHMAEIAASIFAEEILGLRKIYSKLSLLSSENSNPYKMDLVLYDPSTDPVTIVLGEVKSSTKTIEDSNPPNHHKSCFADLFTSLRQYSQADYEFDFQAAKDRMSELSTRERARVKKALTPYSFAAVRYAGFIVIDSSTFLKSEAEVLSTRRCVKDFDVDLLCVEQFPSISINIYDHLGHILQHLRALCS